MPKSKNSAQRSESALRVKEMINQRREEKKAKKNREEALLAMQIICKKFVSEVLSGGKPPIPEKNKVILLEGYNSFKQPYHLRFTRFLCCA